MEIVLTLALPRDAMSVPVARRIVDVSLRSVGVVTACASDVAVALSEACTNVLKHSGPGDEYEVRFELANDVCTIKVVDVGTGFDPSDLSASGAPPDAERGRGVQLIRAMVDRLSFSSRPCEGSVVSMEKTLEYADGSLLDRTLADQRH